MDKLHVSATETRRVLTEKLILKTMLCLRGLLFLLVIKSSISAYCCQLHILYIAYKEVKPFIFTNKDNKIDGILPTTIQQLTRVCGDGQATITPEHIKQNQMNINISIVEIKQLFTKKQFTRDSTNKSLLLFPFFGSTHGVMQDYHFRLPLEEREIVKAKQIAIMMHRRHISMTRKYIESMQNYSGLYSAGLALTLIFTIAMSFLENTHLFKDGILFSTLALNYWLAYISVTTVGYGDRVPRSVLGRLYDTVWIGAGMIMTCSVTANVLSYILTEVNIDLRKKSIGVLNASYEAEIALSDYPFSTIVRYNTYEDVKNAVIKDTVSAGLLNADYVSWIL